VLAAIEYCQPVKYPIEWETIGEEHETD